MFFYLISGLKFCEINVIIWYNESYIYSKDMITIFVHQHHTGGI